ncbi:MAG: ATP-dependent DNA helicase PcrA [Phycisphaerales bacterium]|nr:ATP-dependent DNA helicase PcrA [Phycisphaerales bacterium]
MELANGLTDAQRAAVCHGDGPLLVLAGPGSGKTRVITRRIALLISRGAAPESILALTFTNKAAEEMRSRVACLLQVSQPWRMGLIVSTFHSFCALLLRRYGTNSASASGTVALQPGFTIYDAEDARSAVGKAIDSSGLDKKNWPAGQVAQRISRAKNLLLDARAYRLEAGDFQSKTIARIYEAYESILARNNALDFDDLLLRTANMLRHDQRVREELQQRFHHVLVDEYQDTNYAQFVVAGAIAAGSNNFVVVGDPDQSIFGWRGADIRNILDFERHFRGAKVLPLGENFRSTGYIVRAAAGLIGHNTKRKHKELTTQLPDGAKPRLVRTFDEFEEARLAVSAIEESAAGGVPYSGMAVLYRMNALSRTLEDELRRRTIPYVIVRGTAFYERREVKDALAYLRVLANPADEVALRRMLSTPPKGIGNSTLLRAEVVGLSRSLTLLQALSSSEALALPARATKAITAFLLQLSRWRGTLERGFASELGAFVREVVTGSGLAGHIASSAADTEEIGDRTSNLDELINAAAQHGEEMLAFAATAAQVTLLEALQSFLASVTLVADADVIDPERGAVTLMSLHASKGLEFHTVVIVGVEEGILPHSRSLNDSDQLEEERRLLFVGMTRAERALLITSATMRGVRGVRMPSIESMFIREIPDDSVVRVGLAPVANGREERRPLWKAGMMVRHPEFGVGCIEAILPRGELTSVRVQFKSGPARTLVTEYAKLLPLG